MTTWVLLGITSTANRSIRSMRGVDVCGCVLVYGRLELYLGEVECSIRTSCCGLTRWSYPMGFLLRRWALFTGLPHPPCLGRFAAWSSRLTLDPRSCGCTSCVIVCFVRDCILSVFCFLMKPYQIHIPVPRISSAGVAFVRVFLLRAPVQFRCGDARCACGL